MATFNAAPYVASAIRSVLASTLDAIEVIVVDDQSTDDTTDVVQTVAETDQRVRWARMPVNGGPAAARNHALTLAKGRWFAVVDSDDLVSPSRFADLVADAEASGADVIADNLVEFADGLPETAHRFVSAGVPSHWIDLSTYVDSRSRFGHTVDYGYLKPLFRLARLKDLQLRYDETLRIAEDDDLIVRALLGGMRYRWEPRLTYGYRKHPSSISHRLSAARAEAIVKASAALCEVAIDPLASAVLRARHARAERAYHFARLVDAIKARDAAAALRITLTDPGSLALLRLPLSAALRRATGRGAPMPRGEADAIAALALMESPGQ